MRPRSRQRVADSSSAAFSLDLLNSSGKNHHVHFLNAHRHFTVATRELFTQAGLEGHVGLPAERPDRVHIFNQFVVRVPQRDELRAHLASLGVGTEVYYPAPFHMQECSASLGHREGAFPHTEAAVRETLALPIDPELTEVQHVYVVDAIRRLVVGIRGALAVMQ